MIFVTSFIYEDTERKVYIHFINILIYILNFHYLRTFTFRVEKIPNYQNYFLT